MTTNDIDPDAVIAMARIAQERTGDVRSAALLLVDAAAVLVASCFTTETAEKGAKLLGEVLVRQVETIIGTGEVRQ